MDDEQTPPKSGQLSTSFMEPISEKEAKSELLACLILVAPPSLGTEDRVAWISVARQTLAGMDAELFREGCQRARETCRFPSEIVPAILGNSSDGAKGSRYISATGYIYKGEEKDVIRQAEQRADWDTYWSAKAALEKPRLN